MTETNRIEFKKRLTRDLDIEKEVVAFLNYHEGGILYIGIDKGGMAVGVEDLDGDMLRIKDRIRNNISPSPMGLFDVTAEQIDGQSVIKVFMASGSEFFRGVSMPRNRELMRVFRDVEVVEALGSGMERIMRTYSADNFEFGDNFIRMTVPYKWIDTPHKTPQNHLKTTQEPPKNHQKTTQKNLSTLKVGIVQLITLEPNITRHKMAERLGVTADIIKWHLSKLQEMNIIKHIGSKKGGHWEII